MGRIALLCLAALGCESSDSDGGFETTAPAPRGSGGFSADLAKELGDGKGDKGSGAKAGDTKTGDTKTGDTSGTKTVDADTKAGDTKAGDAKAGDAKAGDTKTGDAKAGDAKAGDTKAGDTKAGDTKAGDTKAGDKPTGSGPPPIDTAKPRVTVKPSAEVAAIKISLSPNWDRDVGEAGTISLVVKVPGTTDTRVFAFRYGYEDPKAPTDRDAYKKWLASQGILGAGASGPVVDRQRGGTWYLEGVDSSGAPVFRLVAVFGGKKLICGGSLYKDATSNQLGDIRDKTILQAKEICETLSL